MPISKIVTSDAVIGRLPKSCPTVQVIVPCFDGLYVFTDEERKMVSPKVINSLDSYFLNKASGSIITRKVATILDSGATCCVIKDRSRLSD